MNENKLFNSYPDELSENMKLIDKLGGADTYEHFPTGWAVATSTPFKDVQTLFRICGRHLRPAGHLVAEGIKAKARSETSITIALTLSRQS